MESKMKEVVVVSPHKVEIREVPIPQIQGDYDVQIQMKSAGVCGSDFHIYHGQIPVRHIRVFQGMRMLESLRPLENLSQRFMWGIMLSWILL